MPIDFYCNPLSPPCRSVLLLGETLGIDFNEKKIEMAELKDPKPEFIAVNPQHTIPTIVDDGFVLWESRVILSYLAQKYGKSKNLYPKDTKLKAKVDLLLYFDFGTLYERLLKFVGPVYREGTKPELKNLESLQEALGWLNAHLEGHLFAAANRITIADFALVVTVGVIDACGIDLSKYPRVSSWFVRCCQQMQGYDKVSNENLQFVKSMLRGKLWI